MMDEKKSEIQKMFEEESREKKKTGYGIHGRASRKGNKGPVKFPVDFLKGKAKKEYIGDLRKVEQYNMYSKLPTPEEFDSLSKDDKRKMLIGCRKNFSNKEIAKAIGIANWKIYPLLQELNVPTKATSVKEGGEKVEKTKILVESVVSTTSIKNQFTSKELHDRLIGLAQLVQSNESSDYRVDIEIVELKKV
jgi:hypothetical protein